MRRTEREVHDAAAIRQILEDAGELYIALNTGEAPYVFAVNHVWFEDAVYFHCATAGRKLDLMRADARVGFFTATDIRVEGTTTRYRSVCGTGTASVVTDNAQCERVLKALARRFKAPCVFPVSEQKMAITLIVRIDICTLTGKHSRSDEGKRPMPHYED